MTTRRTPLAVIGKCPKCGYVLHEGQRPCGETTPAIDPSTALRAASEREARLGEAGAAFLKAFDELVADSRGVDGLHMNGDLAEWSDLLPGGYMEEWLGPIEAFRAALDAKEA